MSSEHRLLLLREQQQHARLVHGHDEAQARSSGSVAIFYNMYIKGKHSVNLTMGVLEEQLDQIKDSYLASEAEEPLIIFYNTIHYKPDFQRVKNLCSTRDVSCRHLRHFDRANEEVTLQALYSHCQNTTDDSARVMYFHSKGAYHKGGANEAWRKHLLTAITTEPCLKEPRNDTCDVCALQFYPIWTQLFPGNFFVAKCSYIRKLYPPDRFEERLAEVSASMRGNDRFATTIFMKDGWTWGAGRQAAEHWVGSHPSLIPCDVSQTPDVKDWMKEEPRVPEMKYQVGPRFPIDSNYHMLRRKKLRQLMQNSTARDREYYLLGGNIVKWKSLYNETPDESSWVWKWYPDGEKWLKIVDTSPQYKEETAKAG